MVGIPMGERPDGSRPRGDGGHARELPTLLLQNTARVRPHELNRHLVEARRRAFVSTRGGRTLGEGMDEGQRVASAGARRALGSAQAASPRV